MRQNYVNILWMLLRLRQACNHPALVKGSSHGYHHTGGVASAEVGALWLSVFLEVLVCGVCCFLVEGNSHACHQRSGCVVGLGLRDGCKLQKAQFKQCCSSSC